jgi:uncharacterized membrane protein
VLGGAALGLGATAKVYPALLLPVLVIVAARHRGIRAAIASAAAAVGAAVLVFLPFAIASWPEIRATLRTVLSAQYITWLIPLVPLVGGRRGTAATLCFVAAAALTHAWFPSGAYTSYLAAGSCRRKVERSDSRPAPPQTSGTRIGKTKCRSSFRLAHRCSLCT